MNVLYDFGREGFLGAEINWTGDTIKMVLCDATYVANTATDQFLSAIGAGSRVATSGAFTGKTKTAGVADADDVVYPALVGPVITQMVIFQDTGADVTSRLIAYINSAINLPFLPTGGNLTVEWDGGPNKIFKL